MGDTEVMKFHQCFLCDERFLQLGDLQVHRRIHTTKPDINADEKNEVTANNISYDNSEYAKRNLVESDINNNSDVNTGNNTSYNTRILSAPNNITESIPPTQINISAPDESKISFRHINQTFRRDDLLDMHFRLMPRKPDTTSCSRPILVPVPPPITVYQCGYCRLLISSTSVLFQHLQSHYNQQPQNEWTKLNPIRLQLLPDQRSNENRPLRLEIMSKKDPILTFPQKENPTQELKCFICLENFTFVEHLLDHILKHEEKQECICKDCGLVCKTMAELVNHTSSRHKPRPYHCTRCRRTFQKVQFLNNHLRTHETEKKIACGICGKCFCHDISVRKHYQIHEAASVCSCNVCGKAYGSTASLSSHRQSHRDKCYKCSYCGRMFQRPDQLRTHKRTHTGEKPYECKHCGRAFSQNAPLKTHIRLHTGEKPYPCSVCGKAFGQISSRNYHIYIHTKTKPHTCSVCDKGYVRKKSLREHVRKHHEIKESTCMIKS